MAKKTHTVTLTTPAVEIGNADLTFAVNDGVPFGRLRISRGGIDWIPFDKTKNTAIKMTWRQFDSRVMEKSMVERDAARTKRRLK